MGCSSSKSNKNHDDNCNRKSNTDKNDNKKPTRDHGKEMESNDSDMSSIVPPMPASESIQEMLRAEQATLSKRAKPLIERRLSCEEWSQEQLDEELQREAEYNKRKRRNKRREAKINADANQKWVVYNNLDAYDEKELSLLMCFMDTVVEHITSLSSKSRALSTQALQQLDESDKDPVILERRNSERIILQRYNSRDRILLERRGSQDHISTTIDIDKDSSDKQISLSRQNSMDKLKSIEKIHLGAPVSHIPITDPNDHELPTGFITMKVASQIIEIYRHGGRLSVKSVQKILRLSYKHLQALPNTVQVILGKEDKLTLVGDLHGQLEDLLHILDESGLPSAHNKYIFNGDFVDRGTHSVEVMLILLALYAAMPDHVVLNRGNHEDYAVCCVYGFQRECLEKYDDVIFGMFVEVFQYLPLFAIINSAVLVVHGGLFHDENVHLSDLDQIDRSEFSLGDFHETEEEAVLISLDDVDNNELQLHEDQEHGHERDETDDLDVPVTVEEKHVMYFKQLQRDALWSDPAADISGVGTSARGAGITFGEDVTRAFLQRNGLHMIVRSHECVPTGFHRPYPGEAANLLCTVFSASNYGGARNSAAYMRFATEMMYEATPVNDTKLYYTVHYYDYAPAAHDATDLDANISVKELMLLKRPALLLAFEAADLTRSGFVSRKVWADVMQKVTRVKLNWYMMLNVVVPPNCVSENGVEYLNFLGSFPTTMEASVGNSVDLVDVLYSQHQTLESVFYFFDTEGTGVITKQSFHCGCDLLNKTLPPSKVIKNWEAIIDLIDIDGSGMIDINEFFEMSRLLEDQKKNKDHMRDSIRGVYADIKELPTPTSKTYHGYSFSEKISTSEKAKLLATNRALSIDV
eukprot:gene6008-12113_t